MTLQGHTRPVRALAMDNWKIVSGARDRVVMTWDLATQTNMYKITEPDSVRSVAFDETNLYVGGVSVVVHDFVPRKGSKSSSVCSIS